MLHDVNSEHGEDNSGQASNDSNTKPLTVAEVITVSIERLANLPNETIQGWNERKDAIDDARDVLTASMKELADEVKKEHVIVSMWKAAHKRTHEDENTQAEMDVSFAKCCSAEKTEVQRDFFLEE